VSVHAAAASRTELSYTVTGTARATGGRIIRSCSMSGSFDVGNVVELAEDLGLHVETRRRLADDLVVVAGKLDPLPLSPPAPVLRRFCLETSRKDILGPIARAWAKSPKIRL
jgi:hypothetical protein